MKKYFYFVVWFFLFSSLVHAETIERIVAKVGNDIITTSDTTENLKLKRKLLLFKYGPTGSLPLIKNLEKDFLNEMILEMILKQKIAEQGLDISDRDLEALYQTQLQSQNKTEREFLASLEKNGLELKDFKNDLRFDMAKQKFVQKNIMPKIEVDKNELQKLYESKKSEFNTFKKYQFTEVILDRSHFATETEFKSTAESIHNSLKTNAQAQASVMIRKHSAGAFQNSGGDSGLMNASDINPEIKMLLDRLKDGETTKIFYNPNAAFIFKLIKKSDPVPLSFNEVVGTLKMQLAEEAINKALRQYLLLEKEKTFIEISTAEP